MIETDDVEDDVVYQPLIEVQNKFQLRIYMNFYVKLLNKKGR